MEKVESAGNIPEKRFGHVAVKYKRHIYVFGGWNGKKCLNDFYEYSCESQLWYEIKLFSGMNPSDRYRAEGAICDNNLYIFGGVNSKQIRFNDLYEFSILSREWRKIAFHEPEKVPSARTFHSMTFVDKNLLIHLDGFLDQLRYLLEKMC